MKNFTNNFKQFTSRLSARWLIMALMMLVGTSSAWAVDYYLRGTFNNWLDGGMQDAYKFAGGSGTVKVNLTAGTYSFKIATNNWSEAYSVSNSTMKRDNCSNWQLYTNNGDLNIEADVTGEYSFNFNSSKKLTITYPPLCSSCCTDYYIAGISNWNANADKMSCDNNVWSKKITDKDAGSYEFKVTNGSWNTDSDKDNEWSAFDNSKGNITCSGGNGSNIKFTTTSKGDITISFDGSKAWVTFEKSCNPVDKPIISITNPTKCGDDPVAAGKITINEYNPEKYNYTLKKGDTVKDIVYDDGYAITEEGSYTVTADLKSGTSCGAVTSESKSASIEDKTPSIGDFKITGDTEICSGTSTNLECTNVNGGTYLWNTGATTRSINTGNLIGNTNYSVTVTKLNGTCPATKTANIAITVNPLPSAPSLSNPEAICQGTTFTLPEKDANKKTITWVGVDNRTLTGLAVGTHEYTAKIVENGCESTTVDYTITVKEQLAKPVLKITNVKQCGSNYTAGKIVISNHDPNNTYILKKDGNPINKAYNDGYSVSENEKGTYTVEVSKDGACGATSDDVTIEVINNTPTVTPFEITKQANVCMGNPVTLSYDGTAQSGTISYAWYEGDSEVVIGTESTLTIQQAKNASYKLVVTVTSNDCPASDKATTTVEPKAVPSAPTFDEYEMDACVNQQFTLPKPNNLKYEEEPLWTVEGLATTASQTISEAGNYTYTAYKNDGCPSQGTPFTVRVNPLPTISISGNEKAVLYEDVMLTATATADATVKWYEGGVEKATGATYVVTSETATSKAVTAKAFLNGCESDEASHTVTFGAEDCSKSEVTTESTKIEIWCRETGSSQAGSNLTCYAWYYDGSNHDLNSDNTNKGTKTSVTKTSNIEGQEYTYRVWEFDMQNYGDYDVYVIFKKSTTAWDWQTSDLTAGKRNNRYFFTYDGSQNEQSKRGEKYSESESLSVTTKTITAPAVKTVSATSEEGSGIVTFTGKVLKTGCANGDAIWVGYQYKKANEAWPTTGVTAGSGEKQLVTITNNPGSEDFTANVEGLEDVDYHFRAYIINGYDFTNGNYDQGVYYGLDKLVTVSTVQTAVKTAEIELVNQDGTSSVEPGHKYCVGETGYIKVTSDVKYTTATWKSDLGVEVEQIGKTDIYQFEVKGKDQIVVLLSNKHNTEPVSSEPLKVDVYESPSVPEIALGASSICDTNEDGTTLTVTRTKAGQYYALYKEDGNGGIEVEDYQLCSTDNAEIEYTGLKEAAKYFVKTYRGECDSEITRSSSATLTVVDSKDVKISIEPITTETTPWMPAKLTVTATSDFTVTSVPNDAVINISGNLVKVKLPLPEGANNVGDVEKENVTFDEVDYTITAALKAAGGEDNPCARPAEATITLVPYEEPCTQSQP